jgi:hypothetical protein
MALRSVKKETYSAEVKDVSKTFNKILSDLSKYLTYNRDWVKEHKKETGFVNDDFAGIYDSNTVNFFEIPSINAFLRIQGNNEDSGGATRGGSTMYLSKGHIKVEFVYLDRTPKPDLKIIRDSLIDSGLERKANF